MFNMIYLVEIKSNGIVDRKIYKMPSSAIKAVNEYLPMDQIIKNADELFNQGFKEFLCLSGESKLIAITAMEVLD